MKSKSSLNYIAEDSEGKIAGYITATYDVSLLTREVFLKKGFFLMLNFIKQLIHPYLSIKDTFKFYRYQKELKKFSFIKSEFLFIIIKSDFRNEKVAKKLIKHILSKFRKRKIRKAKVSVLADNIQVNRLLEYFDFNLETSFFILDKKINFYTVNV